MKPIAMPECPVCSGREASESFSKDNFRHFHCRHCHALYVFPVPTGAELDAYYVARGEETRSSQCWERETLDLRHYESIWDRALQLIEADAGRGPLLDVGCGGGQFLAFARRRGWEELEGIEPSPPAAALAREQAQAVVHPTDFLSSGLEPGRFAGITMWNVLEHTPAPRDFVREVSRLVRPSGVFVADCPNRYGLTMRLIGKRAFVVMPPEHLTYFGHRSLGTLLESAGFRVRRLQSNTIYVGDWVRFLGCHRKETEARASHLRWYGRLTASTLSLRAIGLINVLLNLARLGDQMLVAAQKPPR